jgi:hypothetical protein
MPKPMPDTPPVMSAVLPVHFTVGPPSLPFLTFVSVPCKHRREEVWQISKRA